MIFTFCVMVFAIEMIKNYRIYKSSIFKNNSTRGGITKQVVGLVLSTGVTGIQGSLFYFL